MLTCLSGRPTSGMTTLALNVLAHAQADGEVTVYIDADRTLDPAYAANAALTWNGCWWSGRSRASWVSTSRGILSPEGAGVVVFDLGHAPVDRLNRESPGRCAG